MHRLITIKEVLYSVGDLDKTKSFFSDFGGLDVVGSYPTNPNVLDFWELDTEAAKGTEVLLEFDGHPTGLLRLIKFEGVDQEYIRSSQNPWDTGGIMDINLRVNNVSETFEQLRELGWHGLSDPLLQTMGPFKIYDILMKGYDDVIIAYTHRVEPPLEIKEGFNLPSHVYNSSIVVKNLKAAQSYYIDQLGFKLLNEYQVKKDTPQENMFGLPFNVIPNVVCNANILSLDGERDVIFQIIEFGGVKGQDFSSRAVPPNRGFVLYRCQVEGLEAYRDSLLSRKVSLHKDIRKLTIDPYGEVNCFALKSPNGVLWEFYEPI